MLCSAHLLLRGAGFRGRLGRPQQHRLACQWGCSWPLCPLPQLQVLAHSHGIACHVQQARLLPVAVPLDLLVNRHLPLLNSLLRLFLLLLWLLLLLLKRVLLLWLVKTRSLHNTPAAWLGRGLQQCRAAGTVAAAGTHARAAGLHTDSSCSCATVAVGHAEGGAAAAVHGALLLQATFALGVTSCFGRSV
jgi:hypothetical protein